jgi:HEAT repeat protein
MASHFLFWKPVGYLAATMIFLSGCRRSASPTPEGVVELASPAAPRPSMMQEAPIKPPPAKAEPRTTPAPPAETTSSPATSQAENQLLVAVAQYPAADEETRTDIEEHLAGLADNGVDKGDIARALGSMFTMENSALIKNSILDELYALGGSTVLEQVIVGLLPNQPLEVRDKAISILQDIGDKRAIPSLWPLLADPDENIREEAQDAIASLSNQHAE